MTFRDIARTCPVGRRYRRFGHRERASLPPLSPIRYTHGMDRSECVNLVRTLEEAPSRVPPYFAALEDAIRWLMDTTFTCDDPDERVRLAFTEMRARLIWERYRKMNVN